MIIQGSNSPLTLTFDTDVSGIPTLVATLWAGVGTMIKRWDKADMEIDEDIVYLPLTEEETSAMAPGIVALDVKGLNDDGEIIMYDEADVQIISRRDSGIPMTYTPGE